MARKKRDKTQLISEVELSHEETNEISSLSSEANDYLETLITNAFPDFFSMEVVRYMNDHQMYSYDEDWEEKNPEDDSHGLTCLGDFDPNRYLSIYEFLCDFNGEVETTWNWGELSHEALTIERTIATKMHETLPSLLESVMNQFFHEQANHSDWLLQQVTIVKQQTRVRSATDEHFTQTVHSNVLKPLNRFVTWDEVATFLKDYFESFSGLDASDLLFNWLDELFEEPFYTFYLRGCDLLGQSPEKTFEVIRYNNEPLQEIFYRELHRWLIQNNGFRQSLIPKLPPASDYPTRQELLACFNKKEVMNIKPFLQNLLIEGIRNVVLKINEQPEEDILKLMAAIYATEFQQIVTDEKIDVVTELETFLCYPEVQEALLLKGLTYTYQQLYPELQMRETLLNVLPTHPKNYFPMARTLKRHFVLHVGDTNTGKTYQSLERLKQASSGIYLAPLRLLALEVQDALNQSGCACHLLTGEEELWVENAQHLSCTIEKLNPRERYEVAVIDEGQMIGDSVRGQAWTHAILGVCAEEVHVCLAPHALTLITSLIEMCQDTFEVIEHVRSSELITSVTSFNLIKDTRPGDALVVFSKRKVLNVAAKLMKERNLSCSLLYGALPYQSRTKQFQEFLAGETQVLVTTDAIGMGVNLPIKRVILLEERKFDGKEMRMLTSSELKQIGGRAGRKGIYETGEVLFPTQTLLNLFHQPIPPLNKALVGLVPDVLTISDSLSKIIEGWQLIKFEKPFEHASLTQQIQLLRQAERQNLSKVQQYQAMFLPVNLTSDTQYRLLVQYFRHLKKGNTCVPFPSKPSLRYNDVLSQLEEYYKLLDLYYSFSKTYQLIYKEDFLIEERIRVSQLINQHLIAKDLKVATCRECGREMDWNSVYYKCDHCYQSNYFYDEYGF